MKTNRLNFTFLLLIVLLILGGVTWWLLSTQEGAVNKKLVFSLPSQKITGFTITKTGQDGIVKNIVILSNGKDNWKLTAPLEEPADSTPVNNVINVFTKFESEETIEDVSNLADYGLDQPSVKVKVDLKDGKPMELLIGAQTPFADKYYAKLADKPGVLVINSTVKTNLDQEPNNFRQKKVIAFENKEVQSLDLRTKTAHFKLKHTSNQWDLLEPYPEKMVSYKFDEILNSLSSLTAAEFVDNLQDTSKYGLDKPEYAVELNLTGGKVLSLKANLFEKDYYILTNQRQAVLKVSGDQALAFLQFTLADQLDKKLIGCELSDVESVKFRDENGREELLKDKILKDVWNAAISSWSINQTYFLKEGNEKPVAVSEFQTEKPLAELTFNLFKKKVPLTLKFYASNNGKPIHLVTSSERLSVYEINNAVLDNLKNKIQEVLKGPVDDKKNSGDKKETAKDSVLQDLTQGKK